MNLVDIHYVNLLSPRLRNFKSKKDYLYNFSCPYCGDSAKNKLKARGYFYRNNNSLIFKCHNCGITKSLVTFLKEQAKDLYDKYIVEKYKNVIEKSEEVYEFPKPKFNKTIFSNIPKINSLDDNHPAKIYLTERKIPLEYFDKLYYVDNLSEWAKTHNKDINVHDKRIIIPFISHDNIVYGYQCRSILKSSNFRYVTITLNDEYPKIYGLDSLNLNKKIYITEGPFDSMFLDNAIAMGGSDLRVPEYINKSQVIFVFDNEPRNKQIIKKMEKIIESDYKILIWKNNITQKDINEMILNNIDLTTILSSRVYSGLEAKLKLIEWKKV